MLHQWSFLYNLLKEKLQLREQESDEWPSCDDLSMAVVKGQTTVAQIFTLNALSSGGHTDDLSLCLWICTCLTKHQQCGNIQKNCELVKILENNIYLLTSLHPPRLFFDSFVMLASGLVCWTCHWPDGKWCLRGPDGGDRVTKNGELDQEACNDVCH